LGQQVLILCLRAIVIIGPTDHLWRPEMSDEQELMDRKLTLENDRREQARWLESLNLLAEALRIYTSINDVKNIDRVKSLMVENYGTNARKMESEGRFQDAANLYFLAGDSEGVKRMKERKPDLVILYDSKDGGLAKIAQNLDDLSKAEDKDVFFSKPNIGQDEDGGQGAQRTAVAAVEQETAQRTIQVKMPKQKKPLSFCPYCGEKLGTAKEPRFCPYCGEELKSAP
jgi:hypothetical protein